MTGASTRRGADAGDVDEQRHAQELLVHAHRVEPRPVLAERLAVIGRDDDHGAVLNPEVCDLLAQAPEVPVDDRTASAR